MRASNVRATFSFTNRFEKWRPPIHQLTCRPKAHKIAVSCLSCEFFIDSKKEIRRRKFRKHLCEHDSVILVTHAHTHLDKSSSVFVEGRRDGEDSGTGKGKGKASSSLPPKKRDEVVMVMVATPTRPTAACVPL